MYLKPANQKDGEVILDGLIKKYGLTLSDSIKKEILKSSGGHVQYIQLSALILKEKNNIQSIAEDERINLLSEEIWDSLSEEEQNILKKVVKTHAVPKGENAKYLIETGLLIKEKNNMKLFNDYFITFVQNQEQKIDSINTVELTKKELQLFQVLSDNMHEICDRELIIEKVWPEYTDLAVSDWTIDRLIARLRSKLGQQKSLHEIITIKTRGYKMVVKK